MGNDVFCGIANAIPRLSSSLKALFLPVNDLGQASMDNDLDDAGVSALASAFPQLPLLEEIYLWNSCFADNSLILFSQALTQLSHLQVLRMASFDSSRFFSAATSALASALSSLTVSHSLRQLNLCIFESDSSSRLFYLV